MSAAPAPINERMIPTLNAFSAAIRDQIREYADGAKGAPMLLDGGWQHFKTVRNRFKDKTKEYGLEEHRSTDNKPGDLTSPEGKLWTSVQNKIYAVTMSMMPDDIADLYRDETAELAAGGRINEEQGAGRTLWAALEVDCGGGQTEVQTVVLSSVTERAQFPDDANPLQAARLLVTDARSIRPALAETHIRDLLLKKLPACMRVWVQNTRSRRSDRIGFTTQLAGTRELLAWLQIEVDNKEYAWNRGSGGKRLQALQAAALAEQPDLYPQYLRHAMAHASQAQPPARRATRWEFYCYNCDGGGHHAYMCPSPRRDGQPPPQQQPQAAPYTPQSGVPQRPTQRPPYRPGKGGGKGGGQGGRARTAT